MPNQSLHQDKNRLGAVFIFEKVTFYNILVVASTRLDIDFIALLRYNKIVYYKRFISAKILMSRIDRNEGLTTINDTTQTQLIKS